MDMDSIEFCAVEGLLGNVWSNLIDNAIKFSPEGEIIYISLKEKMTCSALKSPIGESRCRVKR